MGVRSRSPPGHQRLVMWKSVATPRFPFTSARVVAWISTRLSMRGGASYARTCRGEEGRRVVNAPAASKKFSVWVT